ncbi:hypothetical protein JNJ66_07325 [Candidatus Saccharibacteria bacterium]|nr:hypothetical protein [Candidatus Saccharibacteria bacterium]
MSELLAALVLIPLASLAGVFVMPKTWERPIFYIAFAAMILEIAVFFLLAHQWLAAGAFPVTHSFGSLFSSAHYNFSLNFYFDWIGAVFMGVAAIMTSLVFAFSRFYMHREPGFKRFFYTVLLFFEGLSLIILAGNFEVLLLGWEFIGISSVLLIAFYRDRFLPARNALKVFSVYRIADAFLLVAIWYAHHIFSGSVDFSDFSNIVAQNGDELALLGFFLLVVALIKSAQFPFSYWLPRAMEGPTTSSAIFYGALSVHMGLFLLLRTYPLWEDSLWVRIAIGVVGLVTAVVATSIARVQSSVKTQIAYASITQIGIMFIEVALGLPWLALIHFACNASLRTYQLLISPSAVSYLVHDQFYNFVPPAHRITGGLPGRLRVTLYVLGIKEWDMNSAVTHYFWKPLKTIGRAVKFLDNNLLQMMAVALFGVVAYIAAPMAPSATITLVVSSCAALISIIFYIRAYATKGSASSCWNLIMIGHLYGALFLGVASAGGWQYLVMYGAGLVAAYLAGLACLRYMVAKSSQSLRLGEFNGEIYQFKKLGHIFFVVCLLFMAFPISPSFLGQEILLSYIPADHVLQIALFCFVYLIMGVSIMRLYIKLFFGSHKQSYHEIAYKSS